MSRIIVRSFVKINLSIDVGRVAENGYHPVDMVMQQLSFHDDVTVEYLPYTAGSDETGGAAHADSGSFDIEVRTNRYYLPCDRRNLAYQAAELMARRYQDRVKSDLTQAETDVSTQDDKAKQDVVKGSIRIDIRKRIPVAGGLAGGSGNGAAVLHALNILWDLKLSLKELMDLGAELGSDVPFCVMGQARANKNFPAYIKNDELAASCARATGRGTELEKLVPLNCWMVIAKPRFSVSTKEAYKGIDNTEIKVRPDNDRLAALLAESAKRSVSSGSGRCAVPDEEMYEDFVNVLEEYTLKSYPKVGHLKKLMMEKGAKFALMSGSGPTVFGIFASMRAAEKAALGIQKKGLEAYWTRTTL